MIFQLARIAALTTALIFSSLLAAAQTADSVTQSGADFGSGSQTKKTGAATPAAETQSPETAEAKKETPDKTDVPETSSTATGQDTAATQNTEPVAAKDTTDQKLPSQSKDTAKKDPTSGDAGSSIANTTKKDPETTAAPTGTATRTPDPEHTGSTTASDSTDEKKPAGLTVASWGGAYSESQKRAYFSPFEEETGIAIKTISHKGQFDALKTPPDAENPTSWDIVDIDLSTLERGCKDGALEKVSPSALAASKDGKPAASDFLPGTLHECGIPSVAWSSAIVFDNRAFKKAKPKTAKDFFDTKRFPGNRALPRDPKYVLELAMMAAGVEPENVYAELSKEDGLERAFAQLDLLRDDIMWWEKAHHPLQQLAKKEAVMALAFNGRIFSAIVAGNKPFDIIWDGQVFDLDFWAIPKGAPRKEDSLKFIAFATRPEALAKQASWFPYGPVRKSAIALVGTHPEVNVNMASYIPTAPANFKRALRLDTLWWQDNGERVRDKYEAWIDGTIDPSSFEDEQQ